MQDYYNLHFIGTMYIMVIVSILVPDSVFAVSSWPLISQPKIWENWPDLGIWFGELEVLG